MNRRGITESRRKAAIAIAKDYNARGKTGKHKMLRILSKKYYYSEHYIYVQVWLGRKLLREARDDEHAENEADN